MVGISLHNPFQQYGHDKLAARGDRQPASRLIYSQLEGIMSSYRPRIACSARSLLAQNRAKKCLRNSDTNLQITYENTTLDRSRGVTLVGHLFPHVFGLTCPSLKQDAVS